MGSVAPNPGRGEGIRGGAKGGGVYTGGYVIWGGMAPGIYNLGRGISTGEYELRDPPGEYGLGEYGLGEYGIGGRMYGLGGERGTGEYSLGGVFKFGTGEYGP